MVITKNNGGVIMGYWTSRGLRGSSLEYEINITNNVYRQKGLAIIQKIPTPITPVKINKDKGNITLAYFGQKSTVDYIGAVQGIPVCFDAKETNLENLPIHNIHSHQIEFMSEFEKQNGISFLLVYFQKYDEHYYLPFKVLKQFWDNAQKGGRKSIPYSAFDKKYLIKNKDGFVVHYLEALNTYLSEN